jgi:peptide/nickel transport system ATP-binding protein
MSALLEVEDLGVQFEADDGVVRALDGVSYSVDAGDALALIGGPGSGKTIAVLASLGLIADESARISGRVEFGGRDLLQLHGDELRAIRGNEIALVSHEPLSSLHPFYQVGTQVTEAILAHRHVSKAAARDRAIDLLELVGIPDAHRRVDEYPEQLSGSMRQLAMLAMALANEPRLLIADEPASALDVTSRAHVLGLLSRLRARLGMALIIATRDPAVAAQAADEMCVMHAGRVVEQASTKVIFSSPQHPHTWELLRSVHGLETPAGEQPLHSSSST